MSRGNVQLALKMALRQSQGGTPGYFCIKDFMHAQDLIKNTLKNNGPDAESLRDMLRACPLRDGTNGSLFGDNGVDDVDLSKLHPEMVSQVALNLQRRYLESLQWDRANQANVLQQKDKQLRITQEKLQATTQRLQEVEREVDRLKRDRERLQMSNSSGGGGGEEVTTRRVKQRVNEIRVNFNERHREMLKRYPHAQKALEEYQEFHREFFREWMDIPDK